MKKLHFLELGNPKKQTIVFLHGLGATHRYWIDGIEKFNKDYHVILLDLLGFGESPKPWQNYTIEKHLDAINDVLNSHKPFILVGHSLGAVLSISYSEIYTKHVNGLILLSLPVFENQSSAYGWMRRKPSGWLLTNIFSTALVCLITRFLARKVLHHFLKKYPQTIIEDLVKHNMFSSTTSLWNVIYNQSIINNLNALNPNMVVSCIHAIDDETAPYGNLQALVNSQKNWTLYTLNNGDHHPWLWQKPECVEVLNSLMNNHIQINR
ncbi:alpha/beta hydrolase [Marinicella rhabdoformis]|uniref:alpha/beta hydrolase n=1 Tax=Marinicella rhabdoformis TaxID=2580566 RepID=UPI0012AED01A|nr:alpha/beta hydrolase [Marinicella rhabdoformis]